MAREVPAAPRVYTTTYDNFKGVDFTNDSTNVWKRRSPTGVNMLPDESGRPFKRHGWDILISNADLCAELGVESCSINKCSYFELAGVDHIVVFTSEGVLFYDADGEFTATNKEPACINSYDRSFFFEGNGISAFYIYGNIASDFYVWRYTYDPTDENAVNGFVLKDVTNQTTVPRVLIGASANCVGTVYEGYNLLGMKARVEYNDISLYEYWTTGEFIVTVPDAFKTTQTQGAEPYYRWKAEVVEDVVTWNTMAGGVSFATSGITYTGTVKDEDEIIVIWAYGVMLPNNVTQDQIDDVRMWATKNLQFDWELNVTNYNVAGDARLYTEGGKAWVLLDAVSPTDVKEVVSGEDFVRTEFPTSKVTVTTYPETVVTTTASLIGA